LCLEIVTNSRFRRITYKASLSRREVALLATWERERRQVVSLEDLRRAVGPAVAGDVARRLVRKQVLERVRPGRFVVRPLRALTRPSTVSAVVLAAAALQSERYYLWSGRGLLCGCSHRYAAGCAARRAAQESACRYPARSAGNELSTIPAPR
jgi:hypothetical protein